MGKGSWQRPMDKAGKAKFDANYEKIFGKKKMNNIEQGSTKESVAPKEDVSESTPFEIEELLNPT